MSSNDIVVPAPNTTRINACLTRPLRVTIAGGAWWAPAGPAATAALMVARNARRFIRACSIRFETGVEPETKDTEATGTEETEATA